MKYTVQYEEKGTNGDYKYHVYRDGELASSHTITLEDGDSAMVHDKLILGQRCADAIAGAKVTRGKNKGILLAKCPPVDTPEAAAWQAIISKANPFKLGFGHLMFMSKENHEIYDAIAVAIEDIDVRGLDRDRKKLEEIGVW